MPSRSKRRNSDIVDDVAATGMQFYDSVFAVPGAVLDQTIKTALEGKDALKRALASHRNPDVTDRALRYRANATPPDGPKQCGFCGSRDNVEVGHIDGHEENSDPDNLIWTCRSCNVLAGNTLRNAGIGRLTKQFNPSKGAENLGEWLQAVGAITPHQYKYRNQGIASTMPVAEAVRIIRATSKSKRADFAAQISGHVAKRKRSNSKGNPANLAQHFYKKFHGRDSEEELVIETEVHEHEWLGVLGILAAVVVDTPTGKRATLEFEEAEAPWLCSSEDGRQLFFEGGNQAIDLKRLGFSGEELTKERIVVGEFSPPSSYAGERRRKWNLAYVTEKDFDQFETIRYEHDLGEPDEGEPRSARRIPAYLEYEHLNKLLYVTGGAYHIELPWLSTSPGLEN